MRLCVITLIAYYSNIFKYVFICANLIGYLDMFLVRVCVIFAFLIPNVSMAFDLASSCKPESKFCILVAGKLSFIFTQIFDLLFWVVLAFLGIRFIFFIFDKIYSLLSQSYSSLSQSYLGYKQRRQMGETGEYVQLPDGRFVLADSKQARWLEYDGRTVHFSNAEFDRSYREPVDWNDSALDYVDSSKHPEIVGYNDTYYDDVWSGGHSANSVDDGFDEEINIGWGGFSIIDRETGEDITDDDSFDDWRN